VKKARETGVRVKLIATGINKAEDIERTLEELVDVFRQQPESIDPPVVDMDPEKLWEIFDNDGQDMGVTEFKMHSREELEKLLGFQNTRPFLFNRYLCKTDPSKSSNAGNDKPEAEADMVECKLGWHQLVGVAALVDHTFGESGLSVSRPVTNMLLADDVGIGKTAEVMAYLAFLMVVWASESKSELAAGKGRPPIVSSGEIQAALRSSISFLFLI
jgi:hypothetical protein